MTHEVGAPGFEQRGKRRRKPGNNSSAVMEQRAPGEVESDDPRTKLMRELDFFPTPPWAARAIAHRIKAVDPDAETVWEPACGEGHFAEPLREVFNVHASDIYDHGYGAVEDFLAPDPREWSVDWIVTNPPFALGEQFVRRAMLHARRGVAVLCRLAFLESVDRFPLIWGNVPMTWLMPFAERVPMQLGSWDPDLHSATAYGLFVWRLGAKPQPPMPFGPGTREAHWHRDDRARFDKIGPALPPKFEKVAPGPLFAGLA